MPLTERDWPPPEDRHAALTIVEWATESPDAAAVDTALVEEVQHVARTSDWSRDRTAWSILYGLSLKVWAKGHSQHVELEKELAGKAAARTEAGLPSKSSARPPEKATQPSATRDLF